MAKGSILGYLSADDILLPHAVSTSVRYLLRDADVVLTHCNYNLIDPNSVVIRRVRVPEFDYRKMIARTIRPPGPAAFFRRSAFEAAGPWDSSFRQLPDYEFFLRLGLQGRFIRIPEVLGSLRVHEESQSFAKTGVARAEEPVRAICAYYRQDNLSPEVLRLKDEAFGNAHVMAARLHLRSGRYTDALANFREAWSSHPRGVLSKSTLRVIANSLFNRVGHRIWWTLRRLGQK